MVFLWKITSDVALIDLVATKGNGPKKTRLPGTAARWHLKKCQDLAVEPQFCSQGLMNKTLNVIQYFKVKKTTRWWQLKYFLFSPLPGEMIPNLANIFEMG